ncbi:MAG TPA: fumarate hydratase [Armatimonadetes bacterium]|nr:fumarate hydratase [Armatimonadota bacterium]
MHHLMESVLELIAETSANLPVDVRASLQRALEREQPNTPSAFALMLIAENVNKAEQHRAPICQDTGVPTFYVFCPHGADTMMIQNAIHKAVIKATKMGLLRPNSVDPLTGANSGTNVGMGMPIVHFEFEPPTECDDLQIVLMLKGGGSDNQTRQYSLPCQLGNFGIAERDMDGVRKCILHTVHEAQGYGCSPGFLGVCIGGDRASSYEFAKRQLLRDVNDANLNQKLAALEREVLESANQLGIGAMGLGGNSTILGCKIGMLHRHPACYFVTVTYMCWAYRRMGIVIDHTTGNIKRWLYRESEPAQLSVVERARVADRVIRLTTPLSEDDVRKLRVGDVVLLDGVIYTGRDMLHKYLVDHDPPISLHGAVTYHCGPIAIRESGQWVIKAAGPTTSIREEPYQADIIAKHGVRAVIGKGGMGERTQRALRKYGAVYLHAIGGAAQIYAESIVEVLNVWSLEEFGIPEAMWQLRVSDFKAIVTMDAHGTSLHHQIHNISQSRLKKLAGEKS